MLGLWNFIAARWGAPLAYRVAMVYVPLLAAVAGLLLGAWAAWSVGRAPLLTQIARQQLAHAERQLQAAADHARAVHQAQQRGNQLSTQLAQRQQQINQLHREKRDAIAQATTGRTCLDGTALRLLHSAPGLTVAGLPPAASGPAAAHAPLAAHTSDRDIGTWAIDTGAQYEQCRQRLDALIHWHDTTTTTGIAQP